MIEELMIKFAAFIEDAEKAQKGNKAAGVRARRESLAIEKAMKVYRKESLAAIAAK